MDRKGEWQVRAGRRALAAPVGLLAMVSMIVLGAQVATAQLSEGCRLDPVSQIESCHRFYIPSAASYSLFYSFKCAPDGGIPEAGLVEDASGNLYGTTDLGGVYGYGTVFKLTPSGTETVLHSFAGAPSDGAYPYFATLTLDSAGNLYGTTPSGGESGEGVVFKLTPAGAETVLYSFSGGSDGGSPRGGVVRDGSGNLYGTTFWGGALGFGVLFKLNPSGTETVLHSFASSATDGGNPDAGPIRDSAGNLYGTTAHGGSFGNGTVFELSASGSETLLHSFADYPSDGALPFDSVLLRNSSGNLYGVTYYGGRTGDGAVFEVNAAGEETVLLNFDGGSGGGNPYDGLAQDADGNLYGTTENGGSAPCGYQGCGVLFKLSPAGQETILHSFDLSLADGAYPFGGVIRARTGNLYGTLSAGGPSSCGAVFKFSF